MSKEKEPQKHRGPEGQGSSPWPSRPPGKSERPARPRYEKPRPEKPRPEKPRPEKPRPEKPRPEKPRPERPRPERPRHAQPRPARSRPAREAPPPLPKAGQKLAEVDEIEVRVEKLVAGGEGLARFEGIPIFVPRSAPGDRARVRLTERRPDYGRAEIIELLEPGPGRREPPCPHFETCGGCDLQHLEDAVQLRHKVAAVGETLRRIGGIQPPADVEVVAGDAWGYRTRAQLQIGETIRGKGVGYFARQSHDLVPVEKCPILVPELEQLLPNLPRALAGETHRRLDLAAGDEGKWTSAPVIPGLPHGEISVRLHGIEYQYDARTFFQAHRQLAGALVEQAVGDGESGTLALDLYAGVGLFALPLARRYEQVIAVEGDRVAARFARNNARHNKLSNVAVEALALDGWIQKPAHRALRPDRVVVDPPRGGLTAPLRRWLLIAKPARLTYVSCHPATLARDLKTLAEGFRLTRLVFLDMFPQTGHMEVVTQLEALT